MSIVKVTKAHGRVPVTILNVLDRINLGNSSELERAAKKEINAGAQDMLIDLSMAPSLTSAGIRVIMNIHKMLAAGRTDQSRHLKLVSPTPYVRNVLQIAGLLDYLEVFTNLDEAVASF